MDLSIIVPVYNVEPFIRACIESIFRQGLDDSRFEVIIVNDGSRDRSMVAIADIIARHSNITVINQTNQSLSVARNNGLAVAKGEYIMMPDSDDLLIPNSLCPLLDKAIETRADMIIADFKRMTSTEIDAFQGTGLPQPEFTEKTGRQMFVDDMNPYECYVWRTLYRREFISENNLRFIPGINYQDIPFTHECYLKAGKCIRSTQTLYIYRQERPGAASMFFTTKKARSMAVAIGAVWKMLGNSSLSASERYKLEENIYTTVSLMIFRTLHCIAKRTERNEVMDILREEVPDLRFTHTVRQRLTSYMLKHHPHTFINLYYAYYQRTHNTSTNTN